MIRATYGHTIDIRLDDLPVADIDEFFYPVTEEEIDIILENGLNPIDRKNVHLSGSIEKAIEAGKVRTEEPLILRIDGKKAREDGVQIYHAGKDVYITERIEAEYISKAETPTKGEISEEEQSPEQSEEPVETKDEEEKPKKETPAKKKTRKTKKTKKSE
jgi:putative RNA 2'-phosphotransferase